jgi:sn-glycerol 3-phosphate transport system permease protein
MVEHRPLSDIIAYAILTFGVFIVAFPVYLALIASTHDAATVVGGNMPLSLGGHTLDNYYRAVFVGGSRTSREPVGHMLMNSFISAIGIALGKIFISILSAYAVVYFRFPFRKTAFWIIFITLMLPSRCASIRPQGGRRPAHARHLCRADPAAHCVGHRHAAVQAVLHDGAGGIARSVAHRWRGALSLLQGYSAAVVGHDDCGAVRDPVHLWVEPVSVAAADHHAGFVQTVTSRSTTTTDELAEWQLAMATAILAMLPRRGGRIRGTTDADWSRQE